MLLYHGTSSPSAQAAFELGIKPRKLTGQSRWKHTVESNPSLVYLTDAYAPYFALAAAGPSDFLGLVEVDIDRLDERKLRPDEDAVEQSTRDIKGFGSVEDPQVQAILTKMPLDDMKARTEYIRQNLDRLHSLWRASLKWLGTCSYKGTVPASAITRVALFDPRTNPYIVLTASNPTITVQNYRMLADRYHALTRWFFEPITGDQLLGAIDKASLTLLPEDQAKARLEYVEKMVAKREGLLVIEH